MEAFTEDSLSNPAVRSLTKKITVEADDAMSAAFPEKTISEAKIVTKDGQVLTGCSVLPKGEPENPLSTGEAIEKFTALALYGGKTEEEAAAIVDAVLHLETKLSHLLTLI